MRVSNTDLQLQSRLSNSREWCFLPICLTLLLPRDHIECAATLITEHNSCEVIIVIIVYKQRAGEINSRKTIATCQGERDDENGCSINLDFKQD